jgi:hypothetical protein
VEQLPGGVLSDEEVEKGERYRMAREHVVTTRSYTLQINITIKLNTGKNSANTNVRKAHIRPDTPNCLNIQ